MLKFLKGLLVVVGVILAVAGIVAMVWDIFKVNYLVTIQASSATPEPNPWLWILLASVGTLIGGFLLGFGLGIPNRTFKQRLQDETADPAN